MKKFTLTWVWNTSFPSYSLLFLSEISDTLYFCCFPSMLGVDILQKVLKMSSMSFVTVLRVSCHQLLNKFKTSWGVMECLQAIFDSILKSCYVIYHINYRISCHHRHKLTGFKSGKQGGNAVDPP